MPKIDTVTAALASFVSLSRSIDILTGISISIPSDLKAISIL